MGSTILGELGLACVRNIVEQKQGNKLYAGIHYDLCSSFCL